MATVKYEVMLVVVLTSCEGDLSHYESDCERDPNRVTKYHRLAIRGHHPAIEPL